VSSLNIDNPDGHGRSVQDSAKIALIKAKFHYAIWLQTGPKLVADLQRAEIWPII